MGVPDGTNRDQRRGAHADVEVAECRPSKFSSLGDGSVSMIFHIAAEDAAVFISNIHPFLGKPVRLRLYGLGEE